jgi:hypothetical protein
MNTSTTNTPSTKTTASTGHHAGGSASPATAGTAAGTPVSSAAMAAGQPIPPTTAGSPPCPSGQASASETGAINPAAGEQSPLLQDEPTNRAKAIFGDGLEMVQQDDSRIPEFIRGLLDVLQIKESGKFLTVPCGPPSNIFAVVMRRAPGDSEFELFKKRNPWHTSTLITSWDQLAFVWVRILDGWRPETSILPKIIWISNGLLPTIIERVNPEVSQTFQQFGTAIATVRFADIKWHLYTYDAFLLERIESQFGKFVRQIGPRRWWLNYNAVAFYLADLLSLEYELNNDRFYTQLYGESKREPLSQYVLKQSILTCLQQFAARDPDHFPPGDHVQPIFAMLKKICAFERPDEPEGLRLYLRDCVDRREGSDLSTEEMFDGYVAFCETTGKAMFPKWVFQDKLARAVLEQFGVAKSHCVMRMHDMLGRPTARYGFKNLGLKPSGPEVK